MVMTNSNYENLSQLGGDAKAPTSPEKAMLETVPNPRLTVDYLIRFTCPEFTSLCPVTGQPDWATVVINYRGQQIVKESLLAYLISYRQHTGFHENCVERIFTDIMSHCKPDRLMVYARFTRRGGVDINPYRTTENGVINSDRLARQ